MKGIVARSVAVIIMLGAIFLFFGMYSFSSQQGKVVDCWEVSNAEFKVRVTAYRENALYAPGAIYVFQSAAVGSNDWYDILTVRTDEPIPIPREKIRFVSDQIGYFFMSGHYSVTTDGGRTWSIWDAERDLAYRHYNLWPSIKEVNIELDGAGTMVLPPLTDFSGELPVLQTKDYGRHWRVE